MSQTQPNKGAMLNSVLKILDAKRNELVEFTRDIARIPSVTGNEAAISETCAQRMRSLGLETELSSVSSNQNNVLGWIRSSGERESLMLTGHMDTLPPADGWTRNPYGGDVFEGKIFGNGISNMKASDSAMVYAAYAIKEAGLKLRGDVLVALVVSECQSGIGSMDLMSKNIKTGRFINTEPTELGILTLNSGPQYIRVNILGRAGHSGSHDRGVNAAALMCQLVGRLGPMHQKIPAGGWLEYEDRPQYRGLPIYHLGAIRGGLGRELLEVPANTPSFCTAVINVRVPPNQHFQTTLECFEKLLRDMQKGTPGFQFELSCSCGKPAFESPENSATVKALADAYREIMGAEPPLGPIEPYMFTGTDAGFMQEAGIRDGVVMGPGRFTSSLPDEYVEVDKLVCAAKIYAAAIIDLCGAVV
ncbi:MAG TPA: M20/M25/M40 family metallo-hydrolase [bacterium]|nr:M20/M25/M40 family metallo-hydrolase [bacterium]